MTGDDLDEAYRERNREIAKRIIDALPPGVGNDLADTVNQKIAECCEVCRATRDEDEG